ncbi:MAG: chromosomal replication initiator protein DnaA [Candidatus Marinimicrobia bacterium]|nr:chromosomal replication initiator protein DnaA [Candidatus Neomarinimicrobiota bacterium]
MNKINIGNFYSANNQSGKNRSRDGNQYLNSSAFASADINSSYTFDKFIAGQSNVFARSSAKSVAARPHGCLYNPLLIHGNTGLGKTHLLHAIGNYIKKTRNNANISYLTSDIFMLNYLYAVRQNNIASFENNFENIDVLLIDDIHFFRNKDGILDQFYHIFNHLYQHNCQMVFTSDVPPVKIQGLNDKLISRFKSGLNVRISPPDLPTRVMILESKIKAFDIDLDKQTIDYIARHISANIRQLEGILARLEAKFMLLNSRFDRKIIDKTLKEFVNSKIEGQPEIKVADITNTISDVFNISYDELVGKKRHKEFTLPRNIAIYLIRKLLGLSYSKIGQYFNNRHHSTIMNSIQSLESKIKNDDRLIDRIQSIENKILAGEITANP